MNRRSIIAAVGSLTAMGTIGTVTAHNQNEERGRGQIVASFHKDGLEGVKNELEKQGLDYNVTSTTLKEEQSEDAEVTPEAGYEEGESEVTLMLAENDHPDRIWATVLAELEEVDYGANYYSALNVSVGC
ncbi:hypothetical protein [Natrarchaeobius oligotrophus]|uniref:hypothetical protein n=1 Tax=Natrarchaeobius oligotrophus TaxID=3455743 RepID=UPI000F534EB9|nr:hypothetical protein [Natrarchaeobius chitinivorans]